MASLLIRNIGLLATPLGVTARKGGQQKDISLRTNVSVYVEEDRIVSIGEDLDVSADTVIDAGNRLVTPGLVDAHTHLVHGGSRQHELKMKLDGVPYIEILKAGGGILSTVKASKEASFDELVEKGKRDLDEMLGYGSTTVEAKSGYGLEKEEEIRQLKVIRELHRIHDIDLVATYLGAHALPEQFKDDREAFIEEVCQTIPEVAKQQLAQFCDVFCEKGVFDVQESRRILLKGQECGLRSKVHADEIEAIGGSVLAGEIGAISAEHLIVTDEKGMEAMAKGNTIACLLPMTSTYLGAEYAKARKMIDHGMAVALATDYNPGSCPCLNMQLVMNMGCLKYRMTPEEVLTAVTLNGACAIGKGDIIGTVEEGKQADLLIWDSYDLNYIFYRVGSNLVDKVIKKGKVVADNEKTR